MASKDKKFTQERPKVPAYGDDKIEEAKGKCATLIMLMRSEVDQMNCVFLRFCIGMLEQVRRQTEEAIIKIKTETEELDKDRRTTEEKNKKERANKIQNEVIQSHKKNVEIDWNWQELEEKEDCKELAEVSLSPNLKIK